MLYNEQPAFVIEIMHIFLNPCSALDTVLEPEDMLT